MAKICKYCREEYKNNNRFFCNRKCMIAFNKENPRKQSEQEIRNRVNQIDYKSIVEKRKATSLEKYGVENYSETKEHRESLSEKFSGRSMPRTKEHQQKIIDSKIRNGTHKHSQTTKDKIGLKTRERYQRDDIDFSYLVRGGFSYVSGKHNGIYYRSSYELDFMKFCDHYSIEYVSAENKKHAVKWYDDDGRRHFYYPDFYLPEIECTVEIKPISMLDYNNNPYKIEVAMLSVDNYVVLTEVDGVSSPNAWESLYEENFAHYFG